MTNKQHNLFVCTTCGSIWQDGKRVGESKGEQLLQQLQQLAQEWELQNKFIIQGVECMSACSHSCVIAFTAEGKLTYLFGDLPVDSSASAVLKCATQYYAKPDGSLPWSERPEILKKGILAKIPPLNKWAKLNIIVVNFHRVTVARKKSECDHLILFGKEILVTGKTALSIIICW